MFSTADNFLAEFPAELEWKEKCLLLGGIILMDFMFFEERKNED